MSPFETTSASEDETVEIARRFATLLAAGDIVCLEGELGAGKTRFVRGLAIGLGIDPGQVSSPTYVIMQHYANPCGISLTHMDAYRLTDDEADDLDTLLGWSPRQTDAVAVIEWPSRIAHVLPPQCIHVTMHHDSPTARRIRIVAPASMQDKIRHRIEKGQAT